MRILSLLLIIFCGSPAFAKPLLPEQVPEPLKPWVDWVLHDHTELACPVRYSDDRRDCVWMGELGIEAEQGGASFTLAVTVYRESMVSLPGDRELWPMQVRSAEQALMVMDHNGAPAVKLSPGHYELRGEFEWRAIPSDIAISGQTGIVRYRLNGREVRHPQIRKARLWLRGGDEQVSAKAPEDRLSMEIYRLISDGHPLRMTTHMAIEASGGQREIVLGNPLLDGFIPLGIDAQLPARLEPDGSLRVQLRPGRWMIQVHARYPGEVLQLQKPVQDQPWPASEIWVYKASPGDRLTEVEGVTQIDARQVRIPQAWSDLPVYHLTGADPFSIKVIRRGDPEPEPDSLTLQRDLWLDFDGKGYTVRDAIQGRMTRGWRLSVDQGSALGRVTVDGEAQFITQLPGESRKGVEVRRGQLDLVAESRFESGADNLPAIGWGRDFQQVAATLHLPPGWDLLAVTGVDNVPASWIQRWTLYDIFLVLIVALAAGKLWGWKWAPLLLLTLMLIWHEPGAPRMIWLYLLAVIALLRVVPLQGRFHTLLRIARLLGLAILIFIVLPFMVQQAREGLYPQLERHGAMPRTTATSFVRHDRISQGGEAAQPETEIMDGMAPSSVYERAAKSKAALAGTMDRYGYRKSGALEQMDPSATVQTGPGLPDWQWRSARLIWNGPVAANQRIGIHLLGPLAQLLLNFLMIALLLVIAWRFLDIQGKGSGWWSPGRLLGMLLAGASAGSSAADLPSPELLKQLEERLIEIPTRAPRSSIQEMSVALSPDGYTANFQVHSLQEVSIPLPLDSSLVAPVRVHIDGAPIRDRLYRTKQNQLWLLVPGGQHQVALEAYLPAVDQLQIPLPLRPHRVSVASEGWTVEGIDEHGVPGSQLSLVRIRDTQASSSGELTPSILPAFLRVVRTIRFGIRWEIDTRVVRESPVGTPISVQIPVLDGAAVVSEELTVKNGKVLVSMAANQREVRWRSRLDPVETLTLTAPSSTRWLETWQADIGAVWHVSFDGIPPVHHQDSGRNWLPEWHPWPGEQITLQVRRPAGIEGNTVTINESHLVVKPGKRATDSTLTLKLRASQGGKRNLRLPEAAELQSVKVNGRTQPIRMQGRRVSLPVVPGEQHFELNWREMSGVGAAWRTPGLSLGSASVNARLTVHAPKDRWTLWLNGPSLGPAVLFWGILSVMLIVALILSRASSAYLPLGFASWMFLGVGLTQTSILSLIVLVAWFFSIHYRSQLGADTAKARFNLVQVVIALLSVASFSILLWAVQKGLLGLPAMQIQGNGSSAYDLNWYQDRAASDYPQAAIFSVPLIVYRALMMAWALWLAFALLRWIKWGWESFSKGGLWRSFDFTIGKSGTGTSQKGDR